MGTILALLLTVYADPAADDAIRASLRSSLPSLKTCYVEGLKRDAKLEHHGRINITFILDALPVGAFRIIELRSDSYQPDARLMECFTSALNSLRFPAFEGEPLRVEWPQAFEPARKKHW